MSSTHTLEELLHGVEIIATRNDEGRNGDVPVADGATLMARDIACVCDDTRQCSAGALFVALRGTKTDGHVFLYEAQRAGAVAAIVEEFVTPGTDVISLPQIRVTDTRAALGIIAANFFDNPARAMQLIGITGTNGKTTTAQLLAEILRAHGHSVGVLGTLTSAFTSPPPLALHKEFARLRDASCTHVVMEVSSHALVQQRVQGLHFAAALFTNLTQDHLDFHKDMESYFLAKSALFVTERTQTAIINVDDEYGARLSKIADSLGVHVRNVRMSNAAHRQITPYGTDFVWDSASVTLHMLGTYNVMNALLAATAAKELGVATEVIAHALCNTAQVPGRVEQVQEGQDFHVIVDFAHTPDGLSNVLRALREQLVDGAKLRVVFGAGGDRDIAKRPLMGAACDALADVLYITSDNPRSEEPAAIARAIREGIRRDADVTTELDRRTAIALALRDAQRDDIVVIAGKGHEKTQTIQGETYPFDDVEVARELLQAQKHALQQDEKKDVVETQ